MALVRGNIYLVSGMWHNTNLIHLQESKENIFLQFAKLPGLNFGSC